MGGWITGIPEYKKTEIGDVVEVLLQLGFKNDSPQICDALWGVLLGFWDRAYEEGALRQSLEEAPKEE